LYCDCSHCTSGTTAAPTSVSTGYTPNFASTAPRRQLHTHRRCVHPPCFFFCQTSFVDTALHATCRMGGATASHRCHSFLQTQTACLLLPDKVPPPHSFPTACSSSTGRRCTRPVGQHRWHSHGRMAGVVATWWTLMPMGRPRRYMSLFWQSAKAASCSSQMMSHQWR
jgi:hypothetical protein